MKTLFLGLVGLMIMNWPPISWCPARSNAPYRVHELPVHDPWRTLVYSSRAAFCMACISCWITWLYFYCDGMYSRYCMATHSFVEWPSWFVWVHPAGARGNARDQGLNLGGLTG